MDYKSAMKYLENTYKFGSKLGLKRIERLLELLGNPQDKLKFVHVAGTNGKGSTVAFISTVLIESGYKVGIFTSPFIQRFSERIKINHDEISKDEIVFCIEKIKEKIEIMVANDEGHPTEFEIVTAMSFMHYEKNKCDIVVLEVGLGGLYDSTNIIKTNEVAVITNIGFDHTEILGNTIKEIALSKAGIIKKDSNVVLYHQSNEVYEIVKSVCAEENSTLYYTDFNEVNIKSSGTFEQVFDYENYKDVKIKLIGIHQIKNAIVALKTIDVLKSKNYNIPDEAVYNGMNKTVWAGRFEKLSNNPIVIIDGAHNTQGARALAENLENLYGDKKITFIFGVLADKDYKAIVETINHLAYKYITITTNSKRALKSEDLAEFLKSYSDNIYDAGNVSNAIDMAMETVGKNEIICVFGSLYFIGYVRDYFDFL